MHQPLDVLLAGMDEIRRSPADHGTVELLVRRPAIDEREAVEVAELDPAVGLVGDTWATRGSRSTPDGTAHPEKQVTLINSRAIACISPDADQRPWAGDQLHVDLDLGYDNVPAGTLLAVGSAVLEVTAPLHTGCAKFSARFGADAMRFVNSPEGRAVNARGINARVVQGGTVRRGDVIRKA